MVGLGNFTPPGTCKMCQYSTYGIRKTFQPYGWCTHGCPYCVDSNTLILMADGTSKPIKDIQICDKIMGCSSQNKRYLSYRPAKVLKKVQTKRPAYKITMANGIEIICSGDHRWLTERGWKYTIGERYGENRRPILTTNNHIKGVGLLQKNKDTKEYKLGYLSGQIKGDGTLGIYNYKLKTKNRKNTQYHFRLLQKDRSGVLRIKQFLEDYEIKTNDFEVKNNGIKLFGIRTHKKSNYYKIEELIKLRKTPEFMRGFLSGIFDSEGSNGKSGTIRIANQDEDLVMFIEKCLEYYKFDYTREYENHHIKNVRIRGNINERIRFFQLLNIANTRKIKINGLQIRGKTKVKEITPLNEERIMYDIMTTTGNFIANGFISHNCYVPEGYRYKHYHSKGKIIAVDLEQAKKEYLKLKPYTMIEAASSCDVFDMQFEKKYRIAKKALEDIFPLRDDIQFTFITKSSISAEYIALYPKHTVVQITVESKRTHISSPNAATYDQRQEAIKLISDANISVGIRVDPIIPRWSKRKEIMEIINESVNNGCKHVTCSTLKLYKSQFKKVEKAFNINISEIYYFNPIARQYYLDDDVRREIESQIYEECEELGITFATCMEHLIQDTGYCDPYHLLKLPKQAKLEDY